MFMPLIMSIPTELLEKILGELPPVDLKSAVFACKRLREVGETPKLWTWVVLEVTGENLFMIPEALGSRRLQEVARLKVKAWSDQLLEAIVRHPGLRQLEILDVNPLVHADLTRAFTNLEEVTIYDGDYNLTVEQLVAIFTAITENSKLKKFALTDSNMSLVEPELLGKAVSCLEEVSLCDRDCTLEQVEAIFEHITKKTKLKKLELYHSSISLVEPELLAGAALWLEELSLIEERFPTVTEQAEAILKVIIANDSKLKRLKLQEGDMADVSPELLAGAITKLEEVQLIQCCLTSEQAVSILQAVSGVSQPKLRILTMEKNLVPIIVEPKLLESAKKKLESLLISTV